jgi:hypothetical protein
MQSCGQSVSAPHGKAGARLNAHTKLRAKRQQSAREAKYRSRPIQPAPPYLVVFILVDFHLDPLSAHHALAAQVEFDSKA